MTFELAVAKQINTYFKTNNKLGLAYRLKQSKFTSQKCDIIVDSPSGYIAIECKTTKYGLYFSSNFSEGQVTAMTDFVLQSGRRGFLVVKFKKITSCVPWAEVQKIYQAGRKGLNSLFENYQVDFKNENWAQILFSN